MGVGRFMGSVLGLVLVLLLFVWMQVGLLLGTGSALDQMRPEVDRVVNDAQWLVVIGVVAAAASVWWVRRDVVAWPIFVGFAAAGVLGGAFYGFVLYAEDAVTEDCFLCFDAQFASYGLFEMAFAGVALVFMGVVFFLMERDEPYPAALLAGPAVFQVAAHATIGLAIMMTIDDVAAYAEEVNNRDASGATWLLVIAAVAVAALVVGRRR